MNGMSSSDNLFSNPFVIKNIVYGSADSLISTMGLLNGIATAGVSHSVIFMSGIILIIVEALSMAVGAYISDTAFVVSDELREKSSQKTVDLQNRLLYAGVMFISYVFAGTIPMLPFIFQKDIVVAQIASAVSSIVALYSMSYSAISYLPKTEINLSPGDYALQSAILGAVVIGISYAVGKLFA